MWTELLSFQIPVFAFIPEMQVVWIHSFFFFFTGIPDTQTKIYFPLFHFSLQILGKASMILYHIVEPALTCFFKLF